MSNLIFGNDTYQNQNLQNFIKKKYNEKTNGNLRIYIQSKKSKKKKKVI